MKEARTGVGWFFFWTESRLTVVFVLVSWTEFCDSCFVVCLTDCNLCVSPSCCHDFDYCDIFVVCLEDSRLHFCSRSVVRIEKSKTVSSHNSAVVSLT